MKTEHQQPAITLTKYLIGFYDMGMYDEMIVEAYDEELARDIFQDTYKPKKATYFPRVARCETLEEAQERIACDGDRLPAEDGSWDDFGNAYYEALNH